MVCASPEYLATLADDTAAVKTVSRLSVGKANHLVVSLDQILLPGLRLGLEGYVKNFSGVTGAEDRRLNASGVDLRVVSGSDTGMACPIPPYPSSRIRPPAPTHRELPRVGRPSPWRGTTC